MAQHGDRSPRGARVRYRAVDTVPWAWGATAAELAARYGGDRLVTPAARPWFRAVTVRAPAPVVFRWLCQLKVAPYSYDLLDNRGRPSPRRLTAGVEELHPGQRVMTIFELVSFRRDAELTLRMRSPGGLRVFGDLVVTYAVNAAAPGHCRLVGKVVPVRLPGTLAALRRCTLAWGDLLMMRKQLRTLRALAERDAVAAGPSR